MADPRGLRARILRRERLFGTFLNLGSAAAAEICGTAGFDWLLVDLEHGAGTEADLLPQLHAIRASGLPALVRVERSDRLRIGRALDLGAEGVMLPRVDRAEEAADAVRHLRYPPDGVRGLALITRGAGYGAIPHDAVPDISQELVCIVQVESRDAVEAAASTASIDGVDALFVGPTDLTHAMGIPGRIDDPGYRDAIAEVGRAARENGKSAGVLLWRPEDIGPYEELGYTFFAIGSDAALLAAGARSAARAFGDRSSRS